uniref:Uncharacterized protein n=1 Tax=Ditylenchus dipsaci TaxID=166011 RepID=A0A915E185_9BILA
MNSVIFSYDLYAKGNAPISQADSITLFSSERKRVNPSGWCSVKTGIRVFRIKDGFRGVVIPQHDFSTQSFMFPIEQMFDSGVHGELTLMLRNYCDRNGQEINAGQPIARMIVVPEHPISTVSLVVSKDTVIPPLSLAGHEVQTSYNANVQDDQIVHVSGTRGVIGRVGDPEAVIPSIHVSDQHLLMVQVLNCRRTELATAAGTILPALLQAKMSLNATYGVKKEPIDEEYLVKHTSEVKKEATSAESLQDSLNVSKDCDLDTATDDFLTSALALLLFGISIHLLGAYCPFNLLPAFLILSVSSVQWQWLTLHSMKLSRNKYSVFYLSNISEESTGLDSTYTIDKNRESPTTPESVNASKDDNE